MDEPKNKYILMTIIVSICLFLLIANLFKTDIPTTDYLLSLLVSHFLVSKYLSLEEKDNNS